MKNYFISYTGMNHYKGRVYKQDLRPVTPTVLGIIALHNTLIECNPMMTDITIICIKEIEDDTIEIEESVH